MASSVEMAFQTAEGLAGVAAGEGSLVDLCRRGDAQAFARLVALHEGMVFNLAARLLGDAEEARDISQDVFLQVYRTLNGFQGRSSLKTWIYRIVVNQCRNRQRWWRRRRRDRSFPIEDLTPADEARVVGSGGEMGLAETMERREQARAVQRALARLSFEHRVILLLREVEGLRGEDIATTLGLAEGTVKSRLSRAREALRQAMVQQ